MAKHTHEQAAQILDEELDKHHSIVGTTKVLGYLIGFLTARYPDAVVDAVRAYQSKDRA